VIDDDFVFVFAPEGQKVPPREVAAGMLSPSSLHRRLNEALHSVQGAWLEAEVQGYNGPKGRGHHYFDLADEDKTLPAVVWKGAWPSATAELDGPLRNGQIVQALFSKADLFNGRVSLHIKKIRLTGEGEILARRTETLRRLQTDGLCDPARRRRLPWLATKIAVIAGDRSDAMADVCKAIRDRWPTARLVHCPATVQGANTVGSIIDALGRVQADPEIDVVIVARGGGSVQDLMPFDDERLCRAIVACPLPVVVSIGHTPNKPNVYAVADASADVPGKVAELVVPSWHDVDETLKRHSARLNMLPDLLASHHARLLTTAEGLAAADRALRAREQALDQLAVRSHTITTRFFRERGTQLDSLDRPLREAVGMIPKPAVLDATASDLRQRARAFFVRSTDALVKEHALLRAASASVPAPKSLDAHVEKMRSAARLAGAKAAATRQTISADSVRMGRHTRQALAGRAIAVDSEQSAMLRSSHRQLTRFGERLSSVIDAMQARDWRGRGYSMVRDARGQLRTSVSDFDPGDTLTIELADGSLSTTINSVNANTKKDR
jgi:exodeoxyribonuclease VII large subunit